MLALPGELERAVGPSNAESSSTAGRAVIFIVVTFETRPESTDRWPGLVAGFTAATRAEPGNLWFE
jgi:hypothetical protein